MENRSFNNRFRRRDNFGGPRRRFGRYSKGRGFSVLGGTNLRSNEVPSESGISPKTTFDASAKSKGFAVFGGRSEGTTNQHRFSETGRSGGRNFSYGRFNRGGKGFSTHRRGRPKLKIDPARYVSKAVTNVPLQVYLPKNSFSDFAIDPRLKKNIIDHGFVAPTPIQDQTIPLILSGRDVIGIANTGTGKTAAFLIPLIDKVLKNPSERVFIVVPTRELAGQIKDEFLMFSKGLRLFATLCVGGVSTRPQIESLRRRPHFLIGTPGRLKDLIEQGVLRLNEYSNFIMDEVDRMVDIGFINDIRYLVQLLPKERHSLFFSATIPSEVTGLLHSFLSDPVTVSVKVRETSQNVDQDIIKITDRTLKVDVLHDLLIKPDFSKVLIFCRTKRGVDKLEKELYKRGFSVSAIHGNKSQGQRQRALDQFKTDKVKILLATDVAARGLDIENVSHVINYDEPENFDDYTHRIGRTGRADKPGKALTFVEN